MPRRGAVPDRRNGRDPEVWNGKALGHAQNEFGYERFIQVDGERLRGDLEIHRGAE